MKEKKRFIEKIQDFRLLPFFVLVSMAAGICIGKLYDISNFEITPPIDAIKTIFRGTYELTLPNTLALGIVAGLFLMMYPAMTNVKVEDLGKSFRSPKQLIIVLFFNFFIAPFWMFLLANIFLKSGSDLHTGLVLYGLAPCIAMVIVITFFSIREQCISDCSRCNKFCYANAPYPCIFQTTSGKSRI